METGGFRVRQIRCKGLDPTVSRDQSNHTWQESEAIWHHAKFDDTYSEEALLNIVAFYNCEADESRWISAGELGPAIPSSGWLEILARFIFVAYQMILGKPDIFFSAKVTIETVRWPAMISTLCWVTVQD